MLEGPLWEALSPCMCVPEIMQLRAAGASKYGTYCEMFYIRVKRELGREPGGAVQGHRGLSQARMLALHIHALQTRGASPTDHIGTFGPSNSHFCTICVLSQDEHSAGSSEEEHNVWHKVLAWCCQLNVGPCLQGLLTDR